jgi:hypothetical protein
MSIAILSGTKLAPSCVCPTLLKLCAGFTTRMSPAIGLTGVFPLAQWLLALTITIVMSSDGPATPAKSRQAFLTKLTIIRGGRSRFWLTT